MHFECIFDLFNFATDGQTHFKNVYMDDFLIAHKVLAVGLIFQFSIELKQHNSVCCAGENRFPADNLLHLILRLHCADIVKAWQSCNQTATAQTHTHTQPDDRITFEWEYVVL